jgi:hypothetical protein
VTQEQTNATPPRPRGRVLPTLDLEGQRHAVRPRVARGRFHLRRRVLGWTLMALFLLLPSCSSRT